MVDGLRLYEEITRYDSMGRNFLVLPDGSYVYQDETCQLLCGKGYSLCDGVMNQLTENGEILDLSR